MTEHEHESCTTCGRAKPCAVCGCPECGRSVWHGVNPPSTSTQSPACTKATARLQAAQATYDKQRSAWETAVSAAARHELTLLGRPKMVTATGQWIDPCKPAERVEQRRLETAAATAREALAKAGDHLVEARQAEATARRQHLLAMVATP